MANRDEAKQSPNIQFLLMMTNVIRSCGLVTVCLFLMACSDSESMEPANLNLIAASSQVVLVTTTDWASTSAEVRLLERQNGRWTTTSEIIPSSVGRNGMAWADAAEPNRKVEGDGKAPAGIFKLSYAFGYAPLDSASFIKLPYVQAHDQLVCVDDSASRFYNQMISKDTTPDPDWSSAEQMLIDHQYKWGVVVDYNRPKAIPGRGSCIFLHVWKEPGHPTSGCTAMSEEHLISMLQWLDPKKHPLLVQLPIDDYRRIAPDAGLPALD
jgi:D-alanyl-D-alanine dipeptidase